MNPGLMGYTVDCRPCVPSLGVGMTRYGNQNKSVGKRGDRVIQDPGHGLNTHFPTSGAFSEASIGFSVPSGGWEPFARSTNTENSLAGLIPGAALGAGPW